MWLCRHGPEARRSPIPPATPKPPPTGWASPVPAAPRRPPSGTPPAPADSARMAGPLRLGLERGRQQRFEPRDRQQRPPLRQGPVGDVLAGELFHMLGQGASLRHHMEDQALDQFPRGHDRRTAPPYPAPFQQGVEEGRRDHLGKQGFEGRRRDSRLVSHPKGNAPFWRKGPENNCLAPDNSEGWFCKNYQRIPHGHWV